MPPTTCSARSPFRGWRAAAPDGDTSADQFLGQIETGYRIGLGLPADASITPFGRLQIASVHQDGFTETGGSDFNLDVESQTTTSVRSTFGADLAAGFDLGGGLPLDVGVRVGWMHEFADTDRPITAAFAGASGPEFTVSGATAARDSAVIGFSAATEIADNTSLSARLRRRSRRQHRQPSAQGGLPADLVKQMGSTRKDVIGLAFGGIAFAQIAVPTAAQAQCNSSSNPPPAPAASANFSNQSFGQIRR